LIKSIKGIVLIIFYTLIITGCTTSNKVNFNWRWANPPTTSNNLYSVNVFDTLTIWAFGEVGTMIKTYDFGENWIIHYQDQIKEDIYDSHFFDGNSGIVVCSDGKIYKTENRCLDWTEIHSPTKLTLKKIIFIDNSIGFAVGESGIILKSDDAGKTWEKIISPSNINLNSICITEDKRLFAVGDKGVILKSEDLGNNWNLTLYDEPTKLNDVSFLTQNHGIIIGLFGMLLETFDGGRNWTKKIIGKERDLNEIFRINKDTCYIAGRGIIPKTVNGGSKWINRYSGSIFEHYAVDFYSNRYGCLVGANGSLAYTKNGHLFRNNLGPKRATYKNLYDIQFANKNDLFAVGWNGSLIHSKNYGETIFKRSSRAAIEYRGVHIIDQQHYWAVGNGGGIRFSADSGKTFQVISSPVKDSLNSVFFINIQKGWIGGTNGTLLITDNSGRTWKNISLNDNLVITSVLFLDSLNGFITSRNGNFLTSGDGGISWKNIELQTDKNLNRVYFNKEIGWIVGDDGLLLRHDRNGWNKININFNNNLNDISFSTESNGWIAGDNGLILYSEDGGKNWIQVPGPTHHDLKGVDFFEPNRGIIVGFNGVMLKLVLNSE